MKKPPIVIDTIEQLLQHGYSIAVNCQTCRYNGPVLDLNKYVLQGRGGMRPQELGLRHERCKSPLAFTVHPPKGYGK